jgi:hypothetical protein
MFTELTRLFENGARAKLLKFFLFQTDQRFAARAAGAALGIPKAAAEKETRALTRFGILVARKRGRETYYAADTRHPLFTPLRAFLDATTLPEDRDILAAFKGISGISLLAASGALVKEERAAVDLLVVVRKSQHPAVAKAVSRLEHRFGLPLRYAVMEPSAYVERLEGNDRLLRDVFEFRHRIVLGRA